MSPRENPPRFGTGRRQVQGRTAGDGHKPAKFMPCGFILCCRARAGVFAEAFLSRPPTVGRWVISETAPFDQAHQATCFADNDSLLGPDSPAAAVAAVPGPVGGCSIYDRRVGWRQHQHGAAGRCGCAAARQHTNSRSSHQPADPDQIRGRQSLRASAGSCFPPARPRFAGFGSGCVSDRACAAGKCQPAPRAAVHLT